MNSAIIISARPLLNSLEVDEKLMVYYLDRRAVRASDLVPYAHI